jgi:hypothetical protein
MIKIEKTDIHGWEAAIRGARNSFNSWDKSDSAACYFCRDNDTNPGFCDDGLYDKTIVLSNPDGSCFEIGPNDQKLMKKLAKAGPSHAKYRRFITVTMDVTGPLYWWKEMDTYKVGTVGNSCSTMHTIADKEFELEDFSCEHLISDEPIPTRVYSAKDMMEATVANLNLFRRLYLDTKDKKYWWQMIQLLPSSYNQKRTLLVNYEVLANLYHQRKEHKLDEWRTFCEWIKGLPMSEIITGKETDIDSETVEKLVDCGNVYTISPEECRDLMKGDSND